MIDKSRFVGGVTVLRVLTNSAPKLPFFRGWNRKQNIRLLDIYSHCVYYGLLAYKWKSSNNQLRVILKDFEKNSWSICPVWEHCGRRYLNYDVCGLIYQLGRQAGHSGNPKQSLFTQSTISQTALPVAVEMRLDRLHSCITVMWSSGEIFGLYLHRNSQVIIFTPLFFFLFRRKLKPPISVRFDRKWSCTIHQTKWVVFIIFLMFPSSFPLLIRQKSKLLWVIVWVN